MILSSLSTAQHFYRSSRVDTTLYILFSIGDQSTIMGRLPLISESLKCLGLSDEHKESLEQYLRGFVNDKRSAGSDNVGSALLVNEALIGFRDEYDKGGASWAAQVLNKVMKDSDNTRRHLGNIVKAQVKRREYYDKEKSGTRVPKSHAKSDSPEDYNDFDCKSSTIFYRITGLHFALEQPSLPGDLHL